MSSAFAPTMPEVAATVVLMVAVWWAANLARYGLTLRRHDNYTKYKNAATMMLPVVVGCFSGGRRGLALAWWVAWAVLMAAPSIVMGLWIVVAVGVPFTIFLAVSRGWRLVTGRSRTETGEPCPWTDLGTQHIKAFVSDAQALMFQQATNRLPPTQPTQPTQPMPTGRPRRMPPPADMSDEDDTDSNPPADLDEPAETRIHPTCEVQLASVSD